MTNELPSAREFTPGLGTAVAHRTISRVVEEAIHPKVIQAEMPRDDAIALDDQIKRYCEENDILMSAYFVKKGGRHTIEVDVVVTRERRRETWEEVARRVSLGNALLEPGSSVEEFEQLHPFMNEASILLSGRHLQHGDEDQPNRPLEVFSNCSSSATSFIEFYLLLNGSGVGRSYDDEMMLVDWRLMPTVVTVIDANHADAKLGLVQAMDEDTARHLYRGAEIIHYMVPDSREGWAKAIEKMEVMAYEGDNAEKVLLLDFSEVRCKGSPIKGMQNRPASGPGPIMSAINRISNIKNTHMAQWRQTMYVDHYLAECVLVGGARRAARMSTKTWHDKSVLDFIKVKQGGFLWSSNNSVTVDEEFWNYVKTGEDDAQGLDGEYFKMWQHANEVFDAITHASYFDASGEPGLINQDKLEYNSKDIEIMNDGDFAESDRFQMDRETKSGLMTELVAVFNETKYKCIVNPCGEIVLIKLGAYCVISDNVPFHAESIKAAETSFQVATRALMRTNLMDALYYKEVLRTNRIGVGITGIHEFAWKFFRFGFRDLIDEEKSIDFWRTLSSFKRAVEYEAEAYAGELDVAVPHTNTTIKPSGSVSKLFGLSEGAHLPAMRWYLRWVQFRNDDPLIEKHRAQGYPIRKLRTYEGTTIVGFPTEPAICKLGMGDKLVTAAEATPEEQYQWLHLLEKYWIDGVDEEGEPLNTGTGNQVSYTLKYDPEKVSYEEFRRTLLEGQSSIKCCSVMPSVSESDSSYEYLPEEPITEEEYYQLMSKIEDGVKEDVGLEHVDCEGSACPVSWDENI